MTQQTEEKVTQSLAWAREVLNSDPSGKIDDGAHAIMYKDPPIKEGQAEKGGTPRILVVGTNSDCYQLKALLPEVAQEHGLSGYEATYSSEMGFLFWKRFFGNDDFLGTDKPLQIPILILTSGSMRFHTDGYVGNTSDCSDRLKEIAAKWNIPIEFRSL